MSAIRQVAPRPINTRIALLVRITVNQLLFCASISLSREMLNARRKLVHSNEKIREIGVRP
jgi:hypothetical protein